MQFKAITAIIVLLLVVVSLSVAGCTSNNTSTTNQTPSTTTSTATHDALLEKYLEAYKSNRSTTGLGIMAWELQWLNSTSAHLEWTVLLNKSTNITLNFVQTYMVFPTTQDATNYLNTMNKTDYRISGTQYPNGGAYQNVTGHAPEVYKDYVWNEGNPFVYHVIAQLDNIIEVTTAK